MRYWTRFGEIVVSLKLLTLGRNGKGVQCVHDQIVVSIPLRAKSPLRTLDRGQMGAGANGQEGGGASGGAARKAFRGRGASRAPSGSGLFGPGRGQWIGRGAGGEGGGTMG